MSAAQAGRRAAQRAADEQSKANLRQMAAVLDIVASSLVASSTPREAAGRIERAAESLRKAAS